MTYAGYLQTMNYNPLIRLNRLLGIQKRDEEDGVLQMLKREYHDVSYEPYEALPEHWVKDLNLLTSWDTIMGNRRQRPRRRRKCNTKVSSSVNSSQT